MCWNNLTVLPLSLSSWLVSRAHERYHVSLFFSLASLSYFSKVRLSTIPVKNMIWPPIVDFPEQTAKSKSVEIRDGLEEKRWLKWKDVHFTNSRAFQIQLIHYYLSLEPASTCPMKMTFKWSTLGPSDFFRCFFSFFSALAARAASSSSSSSS